MRGGCAGYWHVGYRRDLFRHLPPGIDGGIEVTASHNPMDYNGMKLVREGARPISGDTGLRDVQRTAEANDFPAVDETKREIATSVLLPVMPTLTTCWVTSIPPI